MEHGLFAQIIPPTGRDVKKRPKLGVCWSNEMGIFWLGTIIPIRDHELRSMYSE
jgi:hypothetical protein